MTTNAISINTNTVPTSPYNSVPSSPYTTWVTQGGTLSGAGMINTTATVQDLITQLQAQVGEQKMHIESLRQQLADAQALVLELREFHQ